MNNKYFITALCFAALFIPGEYSLYFFPLAVAYLLFLDRGLFNFVFKKSFLIFLTILLFLQPLLTGKKNITLLGLYFSSDAFLNGFLMMLRAVVMIPSITYLSKTADKKKLQKIFGRIGIKDFDEIFNYSQQMFPKLKEHTKEFFSSERKRLYNPVEFIAQFIAFLIKSTQTYTLKSKEEDIL
jgi:energy-coupling factor transporter transmembrane protein EcfT